MNIVDLKDVIECLGKHRRLEYYYPDKYGVALLLSLMGNNESVAVSEVKQSPFAKLLKVSSVRDILSSAGSGYLNRRHLEEYFADEYETFVLTLSSWGSRDEYLWDQLSRPGGNLVLQLNFNGEHQQVLNRYQVNGDSFKSYFHPCHRKRNTVAWARVDFDLSTGEALIEEVQSDWLSEANQHFNKAKHAKARGDSEYKLWGRTYSVSSMGLYSQLVVKQYAKLWSEVMLHSTIRLLVDEIGIRRIYYHTFETGCWMKRIEGTGPPKSLYTALPKKFCFSPIDRGPEFILNDKHAAKRIKHGKKKGIPINWNILQL